VYYPYDTTAERIAATDRLFFRAILDSGLGAHFSSAVRTLMSAPGSTQADYYAVKLLYGLTEDIVDGRDCGSGARLAPDIVQRLAKTWRKLTAMNKDLQTFDAASTSEWDRFVSGLSSDRLRPWRLSAYAREALIKPRIFVQFCQGMTDTISAIDRTALVDWYVSMATERSRGSFRAPSWLK